MKTTDESAKRLGEAIRQYRGTTSITEFASKVHINGQAINPVYITQIEKHGKMPSPQTMKAILDALPIDKGDKLSLFIYYLKIKEPDLAELIENVAIEKNASSKVKELKELLEKARRNPALANATIPEQLASLSKKKN